MSATYIKRLEAVFLCSHPKGPKMSVLSAAKYLHRSKAFVSKWVTRFKTNKNVDDLPERGTKRATVNRTDRTIISFFARNPALTLRQGQQQLAKRNINVSIATIRRRLRENKIQWRSVRTKPLLKQQHVKKRLLWAREHVTSDWQNVIFTDEASFWAFAPQHKAWTVRGKPLLQRSVKHPLKVHVWGCFSALGFGKLHIFTENLNAHKMTLIYKKYLLPSAKKWFGDDPSTWVLQEDNDPKHRSRRCVSWKTENGIQVLEWPSQSPDANPIENVWALMKNQLRGTSIFNYKSLCRKIRQIWRSLSEEYAEKLVESMPRRCEAILQNNGDWTLY